MYFLDGQEIVADDNYYNFEVHGECYNSFYTKKYNPPDSKGGDEDKHYEDESDEEEMKHEFRDDFEDDFEDDLDDSLGDESDNNCEYYSP